MILTKLAEPTKPSAVRLPARFTDGLVAGVCDRAGLHAGRSAVPCAAPTEERVGRDVDLQILVQRGETGAWDPTPLLQLYLHGEVQETAEVTRSRRGRQRGVLS